MLLTAADPWSPNYGCFVTDFGCQASQTVAGFMASTIRNLGDFIATMIGGAFNLQITSGDWTVANHQFTFWIAVMAPIILIIALVQIGIAMVLQDWQRIGRTAAAAGLAIPFSIFAVYLMRRFTTVVDGVTGNLTTAVQGGGLSDALLRFVGIFDAPGDAAQAGLANAQFSQSSVIYRMAAEGAASQGAIGEYVLAVLVVGVMMVASIFLYVAMYIRIFGLLALAALAPVGLMMIGQPKLTAWAQKWMSLTTGLLIAKPLAAAIILLAVSVTDGSTDLGLVLTAAGAVVAASFSPLWATRLVSFAGAEVGTALHRRFSVRDQFSRAGTAAAPVRSVTRLINVGR